MSKYPNPVSYAGRKANQSLSGQSRFATQAEAEAASADDLMISPLTLSQAIDDVIPDASTTVKGKVELATAGEMSTGTSTTLVPAVKVAFDYINSVAIAGAPAWSETVSGIGQLSTTLEATTGTNDDTAMTPLKVAQVLASPPAIGGTAAAAGSFTTLAASGLASLSGSATILTAGTALNLGSDNSGDAVNLGVGTTARAIGIGNSAAAHVVTIGSTTGASQVVLNSGTGGIQMASTGAGDITINSDDTVLIDADGVLELNSSAGVISIGNDADSQNINLGTGGARTITLGNSTGATSLVLESGTGAINIGANAIAHSLTLGNNTGATALVLEVGTGNFTLDGVGASTYSIGSATTTGTILIGGTAQTGTITLGDSSGTNIVQIGSGEGATTVNVAGGATAAKVVNIATGAVANVVTIGSVSGAAQLDLKVGTGNFSLDGAATSTYDIGAATTSGTISIGGTSQTGTGTLFGGDGAQTVNIANSTGGKTVNIASGAGANAVTIGSTNTTSATTINAGSGDITMVGDVDVSTGDLKISGAAKQLQVEGGAATDFIGTATLVNGTVTVLNTNIGATDRIFVQRQSINGSTALGELTYSISAATSFTITSVQAGTPASTETNDVSVVMYFIVRQL